MVAQDSIAYGSKSPKKMRVLYGPQAFSSLYLARKDSRGFLVVRTILTRVGAWLYGNTHPSLVTFQRNHGKMENGLKNSCQISSPRNTENVKIRSKKVKPRSRESVGENWESFEPTFMSFPDGWQKKPPTDGKVFARCVFGFVGKVQIVQGQV